MSNRLLAFVAAGLLTLAPTSVGCDSGTGDDGNENTNDINNNNNGSGDVCEDHTDCSVDEICDPASATCVDNTCGDGVTRADEACDEGEDNGVSPSTCLADCTENTCGDGYLGGDEQCDTDVPAGLTCDSETSLPTGDLDCTATCEVDTSGCYDCGDGVIDGPEVCDTQNLDGTTCADVGFDAGDLACQTDCMAFDDSDCTRCGDGACDLAEGARTSTCPADCGWVDLAVGSRWFFGTVHSCGVKADGTVWCWGENTVGQLGNGTYDSTSLPTQVATLSGAREVSVGGLHSCALKEDQTAWCWGSNSAGQLGNASYMSSSIPVQVVSSRPFVALDLSPLSASCGIVDDATRLQAVCWGSGPRGVADTSNSPVPTSIDPSLKTISVNFSHGCGVHESDAAIYCWGANDYGELGTGDTTDSLAPVLAQPPGSLDASGVFAGDDHTCALLTDATVACWGSNNFGQLGTTHAGSSFLPLTVDGFGSVSMVDMASGSEHYCAIGSDQLLYCWGLNGVGQLGDTTTDPRTPPAAEPVVGLTGVVSVWAGRDNTCAVDTAGRAWCWGSNVYGQLGTGPADVGSVFSSPVLVADPYE